MPRVDLPPVNDLRRSPINIVEFNSIDNQHFITTIINCREKFDLLGDMQARYSLVMTDAIVSQDHVVIFQLLGLCQYHLLFSFSSMMRGHVSEAWSSARVAIDAAFIGEYLIRNPEKQFEYLQSDWDIQTLPKKYRNLIKSNKSTPNDIIPYLLPRYDMFSSHASHADVNVFVHRLVIRQGEVKTMSFSPFQLPDDPNEFRKYLLDLIVTFSLVLDMFSVFVQVNCKNLPEDWSAHMKGFVAHVLQRYNYLEALQKAAEQKTDGVQPNE